MFYTRPISGEWRELLPNRHSFKEAWQVLLHDLHIKKMLPPQNKYNAAQRIAYTSIIVMGLGSLITGYSNLQTRSILLAYLALRRLSLGKDRTFYFDCWLCIIFYHSYCTGNNCWLE